MIYLFIYLTNSTLPLVTSDHTIRRIRLLICPGYPVWLWPNGYFASAPHSSTLVWKIPWTEEPGRLQSMGLLGVGHDWATSLSLSCIGEGNGNPLQYSCLENPRDGVTQSRTRLKWLSSSSKVMVIDSVSLAEWAFGWMKETKNDWCVQTSGRILHLSLCNL